MSDVLVIEWSRDGLSALVVASGGHGAIRNSASISSMDFADPQISTAQAGESLRAWLAQEEISAEETVVVVPREAVVIRRLELPQAPPDELPELVRFQTATRTSASIETLALDYLPLPVQTPEQGQEVISFSMEREAVNRIQAVCQAAKLDVKRITLSSLTVAELVRSTGFSDLGASQPDLVIYQQGGRVEFSIIDFGTLTFSHSTQLPEVVGVERLKPLKSDLVRCLVALNQARPDVELGRCFYVSNPVDEDVLNLLEQRFPGAVTQVEASGGLPGRIPTGFESLYGASLSSRDDRLRLDLLHPRRKKEVRDRRKFYYGTGAVVALLALILVYAVFYSKKSTLENSIQALRKEIDSKSEQLKKGKPKADAHQRLARWQEGDSDAIELWNQLRMHLTSTDRVYFTEIRVIPLAGEIQARYVGRGHARTRRDVDELNQMLSDFGFKVRPTTASPGSRDPDYPLLFELDVELPRGLQAAPIAENTTVSTVRPSLK